MKKFSYTGKVREFYCEHSYTRHLYSTMNILLYCPFVHVMCLSLVFETWAHIYLVHGRCSDVLMDVMVFLRFPFLFCFLLLLGLDICLFLSKFLSLKLGTALGISVHYSDTQRRTGEEVTAGGPPGAWSLLWQPCCV